MDIKKKLTCTLSENDVKEIVAAYFAEEGYRVTKDDVVLLVENKWFGYGMDECQAPAFKECVVTIKGDLK